MSGREGGSTPPAPQSVPEGLRRAVELVTYGLVYDERSRWQERYDLAWDDDAVRYPKLSELSANATSEILRALAPQSGDGSEGEAGDFRRKLYGVAEGDCGHLEACVVQTLHQGAGIEYEEAVSLAKTITDQFRREYRRSTPVPDERLAALLGEARVIVRACQWGSTANYGASAACPMCRNAHERGHLEGCEIPTWLAAASPKTLSEDWLEARQRSVVVICEYCAGPLTCDSCDNPRPAGEGEP